MAEVQVHSWAEFVEAIGTAGNTVICPENAVWDMNEIAPEGVASLPTIAATTINGNGTTIKNLRTGSYFYMTIAVVQTFNALHFENFISESQYGLFRGNGSSGTNYTYFNGCRFSGILPVNARTFFTNTRKTPRFSRCSFALEYAYTGTQAVDLGATISGTLQFCNVYVQLPSGTEVNTGGATWSYIRIDCPKQTRLFVTGATANVYDGDLPAVTSVDGAPSTYTCIFNASAIPNLASTSMMQGVTAAQMIDATYLSSIGFPIGVDA